MANFSTLPWPILLILRFEFFLPELSTIFLDFRRFRRNFDSSVPTISDQDLRSGSDPADRICRIHRERGFRFQDLTFCFDNNKFRSDLLLTLLKLYICYLICILLLDFDKRFFFVYFSLSLKFCPCLSEYFGVCVCGCVDERQEREESGRESERPVM